MIWKNWLLGLFFAAALRDRNRDSVRSVRCSARDGSNPFVRLVPSIAYQVLEAYPIETGLVQWFSLRRLEFILAFANQLLNALDQASIAPWRDTLEHVPLPFRTVLAHIGVAADWIYFVEDGLISLLSEYEPGRMIEVGMVGREGLHDAGFILGDEQAAFQSTIQVEGYAYRMPRSAFREALDTLPELSILARRYVRALELQVASTASANGRALLEQRLSRWLLMVQDRLQTNVFQITHEFMAQMLCTRRPGVTVALHLLEGKGLISSTRGQVEIRDRDGLVEEAAGSYGKAEAHYARLLGWDFRGRLASNHAAVRALQEN